MKLIILLLFCSFHFPFLLKGQSYYCNTNNEFVCINNDRITLKLNNSDGLGSYSVGIGIIDVNEKKISVKQFLDITERTTVMSTETIAQGLHITILDHFQTPFSFADVIIQDVNKSKILFKGYTDLAGNLILNNGKEKTYLNQDIILTIETLGFHFEKKLFIASNTQYTFTSQLDFPFYLLKKGKKIKIKKLSQSELRIEYNNKVRFFQKSDKDGFQCNFKEK